MKLEDEKLGLETDGDGSHDEPADYQPPEEQPVEHTLETAETEHPEAGQSADEPLDMNGEMHDDSGAEPEQDRGSSTDNEDYAPRSAVEERLTNDTVDDLPSRFKATALDETPTASDTDGQVTPKMGKAAQKRARKAAQTATGKDSPADAEFKCAVCQAGFPSKTQLFNHIKKNPDHAAPPSQVRAGAKGKGKRK